MNYSSDQIIANRATIELSADGEVCVYTLQETNRIVDVTRYFPSDSTFAGFAPERVFDSRTGTETVDGGQSGEGFTPGEPVPVEIAGQVGVAENASAVVVQRDCDPANSERICHRLPV